MLTRVQQIQKRVFDIVFSALGIVLAFPVMILAWAIATLETGSNGLFMQKRIGKHGKPFYLFKIKTMKEIEGVSTTVTTRNDIRITKSGLFFRKTKIDELPQLFNILSGKMSFVGPRPDVPGFADRLEGENREILQVAPGITGPATIKYKNEESLLAKQEDPEWYNREVIWPDKVEINRKYLQEWSLKKDINYIMKTIAGSADA